MRPPIYIPEPDDIRVDSSSAIIILILFVSALAFFPVVLFFYVVKILIQKIFSKPKVPKPVNTSKVKTNDQETIRFYTI